MQREKLSVVIPALNEAETIQAVIESVRQAIAAEDEILVVDDGSSDNTVALALAAGARVHEHRINRGKGAALRTGASVAEGELLLFIDADGQDEPREIERLLNALDDQVWMVIGSRFLGDFKEGAITQLNRMGSVFLLRLMNRLYGAQITDPFAGFRLIRRRDFLDLNLSVDGFEIEMEMVLAGLQGGHRIVEVPVSRYRREHGASHLHPVRDGLQILKRIVAYKIRRR